MGRRIREEKENTEKEKNAPVPPPRLLLFHPGAARGKLSVRQVPVCALPLPCRGPVSYLERAEQKVGYAQQRLRSSCKQGSGTASPPPALVGSSTGQQRGLVAPEPKRWREKGGSTREEVGHRVEVSS